MRSPEHTANNWLDIYYVCAKNFSSEEMQEFLSEEENKSAASKLRSEDKHISIVGKAVLRKILSLYTNQDPREISFLRLPNGKRCVYPELNLAFSLAHTENMIVIGVTDIAQIGVDVESAGRNVQHTALCNFLFSENERQEYSLSNETERQRILIECWIKKEAVLKALGTGLTIPMNELEVSLTETVNAGLVSALFPEYEQSNWMLNCYDLPGNFKVAVATNAPVKNYRLIDGCDLTF